MIITVLSGGARGDTQPYAALARGFQRAGHTTRLAAIAEFASLVDGTGVQVLKTNIDARKMLESEDAKQMFGSGRNSLRFLTKFSKMLEPIVERGVADLVSYCRESDALVLASISIVAGTAQMERLGIPFLAAYPFPATPTATMPCVLFSELPAWLPGRWLYNRLSHWLFDRIAYRLLGRLHHRALRRYPMPARVVSGPMPILYGFSPSVVDRPPDWPEHVSITGYWFLDAPGRWQPSPALTAFLSDGPPPVYVGFGSMNDRDPLSATKLVCQALERAERRGLLVTGWGGLQAGELPKHVFGADAIPHDWLFPRVAAVVHHCGAGTTGAGLRAGVPTVGVPHFADQYFWARRIERLGVGPRAIPRRKLTIDRLAQAIRAATDDPGIRDRARALGERVRSEDGVAVAVERATSYFERARFITL
jgi:UDP:flavonoid glycosyltransferase YjiC (YdhE family)